jgi:hypothetical protein
VLLRCHRTADAPIAVYADDGARASLHRSAPCRLRA